MPSRPAFYEDRAPGQWFTPGRGAALAGSLLLNLGLLAGVVAAMRAPDFSHSGGAPALVSVALTPPPHKAAPPPSRAAKPAMTKPVRKRLPAAVSPPARERPAPLLVTQPASVPASPPLPSLPRPQALPAPVPAPQPVPVAAEPAPDRLEAYRQQLWQRILAARPRGVRGAGTVTIRFRIDHSGALVSAAVAGSSGQFMLDRAALQAVRRAAPFPSPPAGMDDAALTFTVPLAFHR